MQFAAFPGAGISIHALREEGDASASSTSTAPPNFYPRPPRGGRLTAVEAGTGSNVFLSTPSARRATHGLQAGDVQVEISIHALREEGDHEWS